MRTTLPIRISFLLTLLLFGLNPLAGQAAVDHGEKYALLVGVRAYDPNELRSLSYAEADAEGLAQVFMANGYKSRNVVVMTQKVGAEKPRFLPLADRIRQELRLLVNNAIPSDSVVVGLAGHGVKFQNDPESYFCPADARLADKSTLIPLSEIYNKLETCKAEFKVLLVDACRNDPLSDNSRARQVVKLESEARPETPEPPGGVVALFSCSEKEKAYEHASLKHGVFFHYVIEGLKGAATREDSNQVTLPELELYVKREVRDFVRAEYGQEQMPEMLGQSRGLVPLVTLGREMIAIRQALALAEAGDIDKALGMLNGLLQTKPDMAAAFLERGVLHARKGDNNAAVADYNAAIKLNLPEGRLYLERARVFYKISRLDWVIADCNVALRLDPDNPNGYNLRGLAYDDKGDEARAIADYTKALSLNPESATILGNRATAYQDTGDLDRAIADCTEALRLEPKSAYAYRTRASCLFDKKEFVQAIVDYTEALKIDPKDSSSLNGRGAAYSFLDQSDKAFDDYSEAIKVAPDFAKAWYNRSRIATVRGRDRKAQAAADKAKAVALDPRLKGR